MSTPKKPVAAKTKAAKKPKPIPVEPEEGPGLTAAEKAANEEVIEDSPLLSPKQEMFIETYLQCWNASEAARVAGYSFPNVAGTRLLANVSIAARVSERIAATAMSADECLKRLAEIARGSLKPFVTEVGEDVWPDLVSAQADENFHLLKKIKPKRRVGGPPDNQWTETEIELEIHDPMRALELIGKHHKLFTDRTDITNSDGSLMPTAITFIPYYGNRADTDSA
jgi:phage terminase small subunit